MLFNASKKCYYKHLSEYKDDKYIICELAKKFNLNFRIHTMNDKANKEKLLCNDNERCIIKCKPSQTKLYIAKICNHCFGYKKLFIHRELMKDKHKTIAYFMVIGIFNTDKLYNDDTIKKFIKVNKAKENIINEADYVITLLDSVSILKNNQLLSRFIDNDNNKQINKLTYLNVDIIAGDIIKDDVFMKAFEEMTRENILFKHHELFNNLLR